jgi:pyruvyl transferase EpsO
MSERGEGSYVSKDAVPLAALIEQVVERLLEGSTKCALLDFPIQRNVGDAAIWTATSRLLKKLGTRVAYAAEMEAYSPRRLSRRVGDGPILFAGGGNFGDLYPEHQRFRERVIRDFPEKRIIQLPQTVHFSGSRSLEQASRFVSSHRDITLLARDRKSLSELRGGFDAPSLLCPDMALFLGPIPAAPRPRRDLLWLVRADSESGGWFSEIPDAEDWGDPKDLPTRLLVRLEQRAPRVVGRPKTYRNIASRRLDGGLALIGAARVVVTDRLHGHILCTLMGKRHVLLDDAHGKIRSFWETWAEGAGHSLVTWAESVPEASKRASELLETNP